MAGHLVDLDLVTQLQEQEIGLQRLRPRQPGAPGRAAQHLPEAGVRGGGLHLPQRLAQPCPDLLQVDHVAGDSAVGQARGRPGQHETGQHVGLERSEFLRTGHPACLAQVTDHRKPHPPTSQSSRSLQEHHERRYSLMKREDYSITELACDQMGKPRSSTDVPPDNPQELGGCLVSDTTQRRAGHTKHLQLRGLRRV